MAVPSGRLFPAAITTRRKTVASTPLTSAIILDGNGMYLTKMPMVPKVTMDVIIFIFTFIFQVVPLVVFYLAGFLKPLKKAFTAFNHIIICDIKVSCIPGVCYVARPV